MVSRFETIIGCDPNTRTNSKPIYFHTETINTFERHLMNTFVVINALNCGSLCSFRHRNSNELHEPSRKANSHSATKEIPRLLWNLKVHYRVHNRPPLDPTLNQMNPVHKSPSLSSIHSNIILSSP